MKPIWVVATAYETRPPTARRWLLLMKKILLLFLLSLPLSAQAVINDFTGGKVKGVTIGNTHCYFWFNSPTVGQLQVACYSNGTIVYNSIMYVFGNSGSGNIVGSYPIPGLTTGGIITWIFQYAPMGQDPSQTTIYWQIAGQGESDSVPVFEYGNY